LVSSAAPGAAAAKAPAQLAASAPTPPTPPAAALWLAWAYLPEAALQALGVSYFPGKHWALTIPAWLLLLLLYAFWSYEARSMALAHPLASLHAIHDASSKWAERVGGWAGGRLLRPPAASWGRRPRGRLCMGAVRELIGCEAARPMQVGVGSVAQSTRERIPPLVHVPAPLVSRVLHGGQRVAGGAGGG
jgi:hypothetical protein